MTERLERQHRYPWAVIEMAVTWYQRYPLPYRTVSEMLMSHGVDVSHKTVYEWVQKFGPVVAKRSKKKTIASLEPWSIEESYLKVNGEWKYLYSAVDKQGQIVNAVLKPRRDLASARAFLKKTLKALELMN